MVKKYSEQLKEYDWLDKVEKLITKYENIFEFNEKRFEHDDEKDRYEDEFDDDFDLEDYLNSRGLKLKK